MRYAKTRFAGVLAAVGLAAASVYGTDLNVSVRSEGSNTVTVAPGAIVVYEVSGILSDSLNEGLALVLFDLSYSGGNLTPADTPAAPPMNNFALNLGITNPAGFGGTVINGDLIQVCGAQNTINNTEANAEFPVGSVIVDLAQSQLVVITGSLTAPITPGEYTLALSNLASTVIIAGEDGMPFWATETGGVGTIDNLTITVTAETIDPPTVAAEGPRYIAVTPAPGDTPVALKVTSPTEQCLSKYVQIDPDPDLAALGIARLIDTPVYMLPADWGTVHIGDAEIVPSVMYEVRAEAEGTGILSVPNGDTTWTWGDSNNSTTIDFDDIVCVLDGFAGLFTSCTFFGVDLRGQVPNGVIDFDDVVAALDAFASAPYPDPGPCG
ncbi:MAG: hypothetical protein IID36_12915 [Planctomycetes bacterium]|nr:hypothetical protein [Planctomycetota bacterium]